MQLLPRPSSKAISTAAEDRMDRGASYATLVVPPDFSAS